MVRAQIALEKSTAVEHNAHSETRRNYPDKSGYDPYRILPAKFTETQTSVREVNTVDQVYSEELKEEAN
jgi:hypothetical protein